MPLSGVRIGKPRPSWTASVCSGAGGWGECLLKGGSCDGDGGGETGYYGRYSEMNTGRTYRVSLQCESACEPPGGAHMPRQMGTGGSGEVSHLKDRQMKRWTGSCSGQVLLL